MLKITVARLGMVGGDPEGHQVSLARDIRRDKRGGAEGGGVDDMVITRADQHHRIFG